MADQLNALPDPPAPAGAQQVAEPAQNLPQELEPIAEPAAALAAPVETWQLYSCFCFAFCRGSLATFVEDFFCLARLAFCLLSRNFHTDFGVVFVRDTNILSARARLLSTLC